MRVAWRSHRPSLPATRRGFTRRPAASGCSVCTETTPPPAFPYRLELGPRRTSTRPAAARSMLPSWVWPSGVVRGTPSSRTLTPRTPKAALAPRPRAISRGPWDGLLRSATCSPGTWRRASARESDFSPGAKRSRPTVETASGRRSRGAASRVAVTTTTGAVYRVESGGSGSAAKAAAGSSKRSARREGRRRRRPGAAGRILPARAGLRGWWAGGAAACGTGARREGRRIMRRPPGGRAAPYGGRREPPSDGRTPRGSRRSVGDALPRARSRCEGPPAAGRARRAGQRPVWDALWAARSSRRLPGARGGASPGGGLRRRRQSRPPQAGGAPHSAAGGSRHQPPDRGPCHRGNPHGGALKGAHPLAPDHRLNPSFLHLGAGVERGLW